MDFDHLDVTPVDPYNPHNQEVHHLEIHPGGTWTAPGRRLNSHLGSRFQPRSVYFADEGESFGASMAALVETVRYDPNLEDEEEEILLGETGDWEFYHTGVGRYWCGRRDGTEHFYPDQSPQNGWIMYESSYGMWWHHEEREIHFYLFDYPLSRRLSPRAHS